MTAKKISKRVSKRATKTSTRNARSKTSAKTARSQTAGRKNPKGGLTARGRAYFAKTEGAHLKAGVTGRADTPEKMRRKGSFLRRFFTHPRGPLVDDQGAPTRLALSAHAWGEPVPKTLAAAHKLALKGEHLLERYSAAKAAGKKSAGKKSTTNTAATKKSVVKKSVTKKPVAKKSAR